jgi:hypothetical protein
MAKFTERMLRDAETPTIQRIVERNSRRIDRWHAVYGARVSAGIDSFYAKHLIFPRVHELRSLVRVAKQEADQADEAWEELKEKS